MPATLPTSCLDGSLSLPANGNCPHVTPATPQTYPLGLMKLNLVTTTKLKMPEK